LHDLVYNKVPLTKDYIEHIFIIIYKQDPDCRTGNQIFSGEMMFSKPDDADQAGDSSCM
jgi:hypothetical protein